MVREDARRECKRDYTVAIVGALLDDMHHLSVQVIAQLPRQSDIKQASVAIVEEVLPSEPYCDLLVQQNERRVHICNDDRLQVVVGLHGEVREVHTVRADSELEHTTCCLKIEQIILLEQVRRRMETNYAFVIVLNHIDCVLGEN